MKFSPNRHIIYTKVSEELFRVVIWIKKLLYGLEYKEHVGDWEEVAIYLKNPYRIQFHLKTQNKAPK